MCLGPFWLAVIKGRFILVSDKLDNSILAFSAASVNRCKAWGSDLKLIVSFSSNFWRMYPTIFLSKSSPPSLVSPDVANTSKTPSPTSNKETSNVPPPKSKIRTNSLFFFSSP